MEFAAAYPDVMTHLAVSSGSGDDDYAKLRLIVESVPNLSYICLDVANGYSEHFVALVRKTRKEFPHHTIMVCKSCIYALCVYICVCVHRGVCSSTSKQT